MTELPPTEVPTSEVPTSEVPTSEVPTTDPPIGHPKPASLAPGGASRAKIAVYGLRLQGRIAGRGDVVAAPAAWLGGPDLPARIDGFAIDPLGLDLHDVESGGNGPPGVFDLCGVDLRYAVRLAGDGAAGATTRPGGFVGARSEARAITHVMMELAAPRPGVVVVAEALFLAAPIARVVAPRVVLHGPSGSEPLVGLRLRLAVPR